MISYYLNWWLSEVDNMVEVINSKQEQEVDGIEKLTEMCISFKNLLSNVLVAAEGCSNTEELTERLLDSYVAVHKLQNAIKNLNNED